MGMNTLFLAVLFLVDISRAVNVRHTPLERVMRYL